MTYAEALKQAQDEMEEILRSGNAAVFEAARGPDGVVDQHKLVLAAMRATKRRTLEILDQN